MSDVYKHNQRFPAHTVSPLFYFLIHLLHGLGLSQPTFLISYLLHQKKPEIMTQVLQMKNNFKEVLQMKNFDRKFRQETEFPATTAKQKTDFPATTTKQDANLLLASLCFMRSSHPLCSINWSPYCNLELALSGLWRI